MSQLSRIICALVWLLLLTNLALAQTSLAGAPNTGGSTGGSISGRVTLSGKPAPGVPVGAQPFSNESGVSSAPIPKAITDEDGRYQITGLAPGRYRVVSLSTIYPAPSEVLSGSPGRAVTLNADEHLDRIDFALTRGAVITGKVIDADGRALIGERVTVTTFDAQGRNRPFRQIDYNAGEIDDRGVYRLYGLPAGRYIISAGQSTDSTGVRPGASGIVYQRIFHPNVTEEAQAKIIELGEGQEASNVDLAMGRPTKTFTATGRAILAETGQSMPGVGLIYGGQRDASSPILGLGSNRTDTRGEFRIEGLFPGRYSVSTYTNNDPNPTNQAGAELYGEQASFEITNSDISNVELKLHRGASITGVVAVETGSDPDILNQASQFRLYTSTATASSNALPSSNSARVNPDGSFRLAGLRPGKLRLVLQGPSGMQVSRVEREGVEQPQGMIEVATGEQITGVRLLVSSGTGAIRGEVKFNGAMPEGAVLLVAAARLSMGGTGTTGTGGRVAEIDAQGRFLLEKVPPGEHELNISFYWPPISGGLQTAPRSLLKQNITVTNGAETKVTLTLDLSQIKEPRP